MAAVVINPLGDVSSGRFDGVADRTSGRWALWLVDLG